MIAVLKKRYLLYGALVIGAVVLFQGSFLQSLMQIQSTQTYQKTTQAGIGNPGALSLAYVNWKTQNYAHGEAHLIRLPLTYVRNLSSEFTGAKGLTTIDLISGEVTVAVANLAEDKKYEVWLLDKSNDSGSSSVYKNKVYVGQLNQAAGKANLQVQLKTSDLAGFSMNQVMISQLGQAAKNSGLLYGSPTLFQRLYYDEIRLQKTVAVNSVSNTPVASFPFSFLIPSPAFAQVSAGTDLAALVAEGENLFFNETFAGNGRTCGTCHRSENNFTIDPDFIATLPANDPLFVAEYNPKLANLENPTLLRDFGLILANLDGAEDPTNKFVMRSVSHTLGLSMSIQSSAMEAPFQMTGWSGDGAPGGGTLRDFSTGAVMQHFTRSLDRIEGDDFRLPSDAELDALEAFMLSLGRQADPDLNSLKLLNRDAERGRVLFMTEDSKNRTVQAAKCNICHRNAGALTLAGENSNFKTGVENMLHPADATGELRPRDGGFGIQLNVNTGGFGDNAFNTPSLWEAADTAPYFHHNGASTLEEAIAFYDSPEFKKSTEGQRLLLMDSGGQELSVDIDTLAAFLRVINVLENIRSSSEYMQRAIGQPKSTAQNLLKIAKADINDILQVLAQGELHEETVSYFTDTKALIDSARNTRKMSARDSLIVQAMSQVQTAKSFIVEAVSIVDNVKPSVSFLTPSASDAIAGSTTIQVDAIDNVAVDSVVIMVGSVEIGRLSAAPFTMLWDTQQFADGLTQLTAVATDSSGNNASATILVDIKNLILPPVADTTNPIISILTPADSSRVAGSVLISVDAADDVAIDRVVFMIGQNQIAVVTTLPYEMLWDTSVFADGSQQIMATAIDSSNNSASASLTVIVDNFVEVCTVYSCPNPPPPSTQPPPDQTMPSGSSPDGEFDGVLQAKDVNASTITISTAGGPVIVTITGNTEFMGSVASNIDDLLVGHVVQGEFFKGTSEIVWIGTDLPPGL